MGNEPSSHLTSPAPSGDTDNLEHASEVPRRIDETGEMDRKEREGPNHEDPQIAESTSMKDQDRVVLSNEMTDFPSIVRDKDRLELFEVSSIERSDDGDNSIETEELAKPQTRATSRDDAEDSKQTSSDADEAPFISGFDEDGESDLPKKSAQEQDVTERTEEPTETEYTESFDPIEEYAQLEGKKGVKETGTSHKAMDRDEPITMQSPAAKKGNNGEQKAVLAPSTPETENMSNHTHESDNDTVFVIEPEVEADGNSFDLHVIDNDDDVSSIGDHSENEEEYDEITCTPSEVQRYYDQFEEVTYISSGSVSLAEGNYNVCDDSISHEEADSDASYDSSSNEDSDEASCCSSEYSDESETAEGWERNFVYPKTIPSPTESFSVVSLSFLAQNVPTGVSSKVFDESLRVLKPGGVLYVVDIDGDTVNRCPKMRQLLSRVVDTTKSVKNAVHEINTQHILQNNCFESNLHRDDPRIARWMGIKP